MCELRSNGGFIVNLSNIESGAETGRRRVPIQYADEVETLIVVQGLSVKCTVSLLMLKAGYFMLEKVSMIRYFELAVVWGEELDAY